MRAHCALRRGLTAGGRHEPVPQCACAVVVGVRRHAGTRQLAPARPRARTPVARIRRRITRTVGDRRSATHDHRQRASRAEQCTAPRTARRSRNSPAGNPGCSQGHQEAASLHHRSCALVIGDRGAAAESLSRVAHPETTLRTLRLWYIGHLGYIRRAGGYAESILLSTSLLASRGAGSRRRDRGDARARDTPKVSNACAPLRTSRPGRPRAPSRRPPSATGLCSPDYPVRFTAKRR
jgi:hypothetical protein